MIRYKFDVLERLKNQGGYSSYKLRKEKVLGEYTMQLLREGKLISLENIDIICKILNMQPGDILEWVPDKD